MAEFRLWSESQQQLWKDWVRDCPKVVQDMCNTILPNRLYRRISTQEIVTISCYNEDGTVTVYVDPRFNPGLDATDHESAGVKPDDLEDSDLPEGISQEPAETV